MRAKLRCVLASLHKNPAETAVVVWVCSLSLSSQGSNHSPFLHPCPPMLSQQAVSSDLGVCSDSWQPGRPPLLGPATLTKLRTLPIPAPKGMNGGSLGLVQAFGGRGGEGWVRSAGAHLRVRGFSVPGTCSCSFGGRLPPLLLLPAACKWQVLPLRFPS